MSFADGLYAGVGEANESLTCGSSGSPVVKADDMHCLEDEHDFAGELLQQN